MDALVCLLKYPSLSTAPQSHRMDSDSLNVGVVFLLPYAHALGFIFPTYEEAAVKPYDTSTALLLDFPAGFPVCCFTDKSYQCQAKCTYHDEIHKNHLSAT